MRSWITGVVSSTAVHSVSRLASRSTADHEAPVRQLLPVIEPVARVMRARIEHAGERLRYEHLAARRADPLVEERHEAAGVAVRRDDDLRIAERLERLDTLVLAQFGAGLRGVRRQAPHPARRLQRPVRRVDDRPLKQPVERRRQIVEPLGREAVLDQRLVLGPSSSRSYSSAASRRLPVRTNASPASEASRASARSVSSQ